ncbi:MAG: 4-hydroxy-tetrahydrodipicolinate synthase [Clostridiales Family XIII bacterium]|jgi:4-hydroxy-tetrahydrodipicolinate synthase|nr:4-hydroxy-tetrahydrodipicolinate synthase [Clostridiales Family XIII bacterium]
MSVFQGSATAVITPFSNGKVDYDRYGKFIDWQLAEGSDAIVTCGTTGEASTLTWNEQINTIAFAVKRVAGKVPVIAGVGANATEEAVEGSKRAEEAGVDALLHVTPYYNKCSRRGLIEHFTACAGSVKIPVILYSVPSRTGVNISPDVCAELADIDNIAGIKEASGDISQVAEIARVTRGKDFGMWSGNDDMIVPLMSLGGIGVISTVANIVPRETHEMCAAFLAGDTAKAERIQLDLKPLIDAVFLEVNPIPIKAAAYLMGLCEYEYRLPLCPLAEENFGKLKKCMKDYNLI